MANVAPEYATTHGPPLWSGVTTRSGTPSPVMSPAVTNTPPVKLDSNGWVLNSSAWVAPSSTRTRPATPGPVPTIRSATPSPVKSAAATRTPPLKPGKASRL